MTQDEAKSLFTAAGLPVLKMWELVDGYVRDRHRSWWLVRTSHGLIAIGWRKRVINIDWSDTEVRGIVTDDDVTKAPEMVHAYSMAKAVEYLTKFAELASAAISAAEGNTKEQAHAERS